MTKKARLILVLATVEVGLAGLWWYLAGYGIQNPDRVAANFQEVVGQTMGMAMGALLGLGVILFFVAARNDRKALQDKGRR
ncbi:MAG: hypothetical protein E5X80_17095 [Mesorhizobium sp.]|uniref:hypothetical protein n=1 Tax=Mesorhizobium sp. TaxID=1871066 RepID=UPI000FEA13E8|nr:hypothetical protein [Mesorhizobium sp.]RWM04041.1 MAG: hypothetical protein EOR71_26855 [Mesorhizobium sp.]TIO51743.1 MAG: hypothetical protein E5X78_15835 [Mesorhizobium sp.]TIO61079.1 MAG: hypothetical protein E5X79_09065 [Mesorhizobium sp.]TJV62844.1 MAG: hypothetical protein E5X80_17095 [Mesorhizobium sp.]